MRRSPTVQFDPALRARHVELDQPSVVHLPGWADIGDPQRIEFLRELATQRGRDPRIRTLAVTIIRAALVPEMDFRGQAAALLAWVQNNIYYINEPGETLQDPMLTLQLGYGDCDDVVTLLACFFESCALRFRMVLSGMDGKGKVVRWLEGTPIPTDVNWDHIYLAVGTPALSPSEWHWAEPSLKGAPLGWDTVQAFGGSTYGQIAMPTDKGLRDLAITVGAGVATIVLSQILLEAWRERRKRRAKS